jgi:hypothetical protein
MFKLLLRDIWSKGEHTLSRSHLDVFSVLAREIHSGKELCGPRSFFGVEDFVDDDNSKPYTYMKEKKIKKPT